MYPAVLNPGESLTAVLSGAAATTDPSYAAVWRENGSDGINQPVGSLDGATAVTLIDAPTGRQRLVASVQIYNADTAPVTVTVSKLISGTSYTLASVVLAVGYTLVLAKDGPQIVATATASGAGTAATDVTASEQGNGVVQKTVLTLSGVSVTVGNTTGVSFGGTKIYDFPAGRILVLGVTLANLSFDLTDAGNETPIDDTMGGDIAVGTTAPDDGTLGGTDVDLIPATSIDPISDGVDGAALAASAQFDGTTTAVDAYINAIIDDGDVADGASDVILVSATVTITWVSLGDY